MGKSDNKVRRPSESFVMGVVAVVFLLLGYQTALFIQNAAVTKIAADRDHPDTVYICRTPQQESGESSRGAAAEVSQRRNSGHSPMAQAVRKAVPFKTVESFPFNPNTADQEQLMRLGFSQKQAASIIRYREKGGRFRRKEDFASSFVVSDSIYRRLEKYIDIPLVDLNTADSADFDALPGIGGWFASRMVEYRKRLRGYSFKEQLMEIYRFDRDKYDALQDLVTVSAENAVPYPLWSLPADSLRLHPYIRDYETARAIVLFRENNPSSEWSIEALESAGIITSEYAEKLSRCLIE